MSRPRHKRHREDTWVDRVEISTVERWKESGLSGDEWRFSYEVRLIRKGVLLSATSFGSLSYATAWVALQSAEGFCPADVPWPTGGYGDGVLCDQPGCAMPGTERRTLIQEYCDRGCERKSFGEVYRVFCLQHARRGDCALEDADQNYRETRRSND